MSHTVVTENEAELIEKLCTTVQNIANEAIKKKNNFYVGLSGGSLIKYLSIGLPKITTDWPKWVLFFCDERVVPVDSPDSTYGVYKRDLIGKVPLKEEQFIRIKQGVPADEAASDYVQQMSKYFPTNEVPRFDLLLLGMGPDGHTCSLFPGHKLLNEKSVWVAPIADSPKPPPSRITLTFPIINNSNNCIFAMAGEGKAEMVEKILVKKENLPAGQVNLSHGTLYWILDKGAAKYLK